MNIRICDICKNRISKLSDVNILKIDKHPDSKDIRPNYNLEICNSCTLKIKLDIIEVTASDVTVTPTHKQ